MKEKDIIKYIKNNFKTKKPVVEGIGDDAAVLGYKKDKYLLFSSDMIIEGTHFKNTAKPYNIGWKAVAINISDIAAMGGVPKYCLVSLGIPAKKGMSFVKGLANGIKSISRKFGLTVVGGDTNRSDRIIVDIAMLGEVEKTCLTKRSGAKKRDLIFVTGALGEGRLKHLSFMPRLKEARKLVKNFNISSMIDLSDGISIDLNRLSEASGVGVRIFKSLIPLSKKSEPFHKALERGEDFELLFTASVKESRRIIKRMGEKGDLPISLIGEVVHEKAGVKLILENGKEKTLKPIGFSHF